MIAATSHLLRGPLLMATVLAALLLPYLLHLSIEILVCLALFVIGAVVTLQDALALAKSSLRRRTSFFLDNLVLDNVLKSWFDPETGWVACWTAFFIGNATMYSLPLSDAQRIRLVQSCLWTSDEEARTILTAPGGFKVLLPETLQLWLYSGDVADDEDMNAGDTSSEENECDRSHLTEETEPSEAETKVAGDDIDIKFNRDVPNSQTCGLRTEKRTNRTASPPQSIVRNHPPSSHPQYPLDAMGSILKEIASDFIKRSCESIPDSSMRGLVVAASSAFALQMYSSPRSRRIVTGAIEGTTALTFASVAVGAIAALVMKSQVLNGTPLALQQSSLIRHIIATLKQAGGVRRVQGIIAVLVLWYVGRRRSKRGLSLHPNSHLRR